MIKICVFSSGRWDYSYIKPILEELKADDKFDIKVILPCSHHHYTEIRTEFECLPVRCIDNIADGGFLYNDVMCRLTEFKPDALVVLGDRWETMIISSVALFLGIKIVHLQAGDVTEGSFDDNIRNCISIMAKYHFSANDEAAQNVKRITGKDAYVVGSPGLDSIDKSKLKSREELQKEFDIDFNKPYIIACMHPTTKQLLGTRTHITNLVNALYRYSSQVIFVNPNIDPKNEIIREMVIKVASVAFNKWVVCDNIEHTTFLSLMQYADCMVGNSSSGVIEAVEFNLPVVDVGNRQQGRVRPNNVFNCGYGEEDISNMLQTTQNMRQIFETGHVKLTNPYKGNGTAKEIVRILKEVLIGYA